MNPSSRTSYPEDDMDYDMAKYQQHAVSSSEVVFTSPWTADNRLSALTYAPGEYLHDKTASSDGFAGPQLSAGVMEWSKDASALLDHSVAAPMADGHPAVNHYLSPTTVAPISAPWNVGVVEQQSLYIMPEDATAVSSTLSENGSLRSPSSPISLANPGVSKGKGKAVSMKARTRSDAKSKSFSSVSSSSSAPSRFSNNNGYGGNHNVTLRTASRKPKPPIKTEDSMNGDTGSLGSSPSSPEANADNLTSEERRARQNHNVVEKQYRNRLNAQFEKLLAVLPANQPDGSEGSSRHSDFDDRRMSKAEVLELARRRIHTLEQERKQLRAERQSLLDNVSLMQRAVQQQHHLGVPVTRV